VSLVQALLEESAHTGLFADHAQPAPPAAVPSESPGRLARWHLHRDEPATTPFDDFRAGDIRWTEIAEQLVDCWRRRIGFELPAAFPDPLPLAPRARLILLSDWGNGSDVAAQVSAQARRWLDPTGDRECHVVHLGDIYYAGTEWEAVNRFLAFWPVQPDEAQQYSSWCLNGNHDMYAAAKGLRGKVLTDDRFRRQRTSDGDVSTLLHLRGAGWQVLGLDSSWKFDLFDIGGLHGRLGADQAAWLARRTEELPGRTVVLSHHQPFSRRRDYPARLSLEATMMADTAAARSGPGLAAWFWGHEHRCVSYERPVDGVAYGACVGYSAMPEEESSVDKGPGEWEFSGLQPRDPEGDVWRTCGFAVVDLDPDGATVTYVDQDGRLCKPADRLPLTADPA
jgi:hypothetical protein